MEPALMSAIFSPVFVRLRLVSSWEDWGCVNPLWEDLEMMWTYSHICKESRDFLQSTKEFQALRLAMWEYFLIAEPGWVEKVSFVRSSWSRNFAAFAPTEVDAEELRKLKIEELATVRTKVEEKKMEL